MKRGGIVVMAAVVAGVCGWVLGAVPGGGVVAPGGGAVVPGGGLVAPGGGVPGTRGAASAPGAGTQAGGRGRRGGGFNQGPWDGTFRDFGGGGRGFAASLPAVQVEPRTHDPVMMKMGDTYYVYWTGNGINVLTSKDLIHWERKGMVMTKAPAWAFEEFPQTRGYWAPDISFLGGKYHMYFAASSFGSNRSAIGLMTNVTLDPSAKDYKWEDEGKVIESVREDRYNCIDPNLVVDEKGTAWLDFGSFWTGIKMRKLDAAGKLDKGDETLYSLASRPEGDHSIEGPFIVHRGKYYYLFVSFDRCCRGLNSTYRVMVGRSEAVTGPYVDKAGKAMMEGGGTEILAGDGKRIIGPGHCAVVRDDVGGAERWLMVHHFYDGEDRGTSKLQVRPLAWDAEGWVKVMEPLNVEK